MEYSKSIKFHALAEWIAIEVNGNATTNEKKIHEVKRHGGNNNKKIQ